MLKFQTLVSMTVFLAATACQKDDKPKPFEVKSEQLQGSWVSEYEINSPAQATQSSALALRFRDNEVDSMQTKKGTLDCNTPRSFSIENKSFLVFTKAEECPGVTIQITSMDAGHMRAKVDGVSYNLNRVNDTELENFVSNVGSAESKLSESFKSFLIPSQSDIAIDEQFAAHSSEFSNLSFHITQTEPLNLNNPGSTRTMETEKYCGAVFKSVDQLSLDSSPRKLPVTDFKWYLPRSQNNLFHARVLDPKSTELAGLSAEDLEARLSQWKAGIFTNHARRSNSVFFQSANAEITVWCYRSLKDTVWTLSEVQSELQTLYPNSFTIQKN